MCCISKQLLLLLKLTEVFVTAQKVNFIVKY